MRESIEQLVTIAGLVNSYIALLADDQVVLLFLVTIVIEARITHDIFIIVITEHVNH